MDRSRWMDWIALGVILVLGFFYGWSLGDIPFHPDESTAIFMSKDLPALISRPLTLAWDGTYPLSPEERYRAIDAPLARVVIGIARQVLGAPALETDWDWSASWRENEAAGALPAQRQLLVSRAGVTLLLIAGLGLFYQALRRSLPGIPALIGLALLGLNPLVLLHGRRAMSEGVLLFGLSFFLWAATREKRSPWLIGLSLGLAINAKLTALALLPPGLAAVCLPPFQPGTWKTVLSRALQTALAVLVVCALLNPFYWRKPALALQAGFQTRLALTKAQGADHLTGQGLEKFSLPQRGLAVLANIYLTPPQIEEVGNYTADLASERQQYLSQTLSSWGRGLVSAGVSLSLGCLGLVLAIKNWKASSKQERNRSLIWILSTAGLFIFLTFPLPWQRYVVPLVPFSIFWMVSALDPVCQKLTKTRPTDRNSS